MKIISDKDDYPGGSGVLEEIDNQADNKQRHQKEPFPLKKVFHKLKRTFHGLSVFDFGG